MSDHVLCSVNMLDGQIQGSWSLPCGVKIVIYVPWNMFGGEENTLLLDFGRHNVARKLLLLVNDVFKTNYSKWLL